MCVCNKKAIRLTVLEISSGNETRTHINTARHGDDNTPRSYFVGEGIKNYSVSMVYIKIFKSLKVFEK